MFYFNLCILILIIIFNQILCENGADVSIQNGNGKEAWIIAQDSGKEEIANYLISKGPIDEKFKVEVVEGKESDEKQQ